MRTLLVSLFVLSVLVLQSESYYAAAVDETTTVGQPGDGDVTTISPPDTTDDGDDGDDDDDDDDDSDDDDDDDDDDDEEECSGESMTYQPGELVFKWGKANYTNTQEVTGWYSSCSGACLSSSTLSDAYAGRRRKTDDICTCCKLKMEMVKMELNREKTNGKSKIKEYAVEKPVGCDCTECGRRRKKPKYL